MKSINEPKVGTDTEQALEDAMNNVAQQGRSPQSIMQLTKALAMVILPGADEVGEWTADLLKVVKLVRAKLQKH